MVSVIGAFMGGMITVISPGFLLILPAVLSGFWSKFSPFAIFIGMATSFTIIITISLSLGGIFSFFFPYIHQFFAMFIIGMGAVLLNDDINRAYVNISNSIVNFWRKYVLFPIGNTKIKKASREGLLGGLLLGISLGVVWRPNADVFMTISYDLLQGGMQNLISSVIFLLIFSLGFSVPMLLIAYLGKIALSRVEWFVTRKHFFRKLSGLILILTGFMVFFEIDKYLWFQLFPYDPYTYSSLLSQYQKYFFI